MSKRMFLAVALVAAIGVGVYIYAQYDSGHATDPAAESNDVKSVSEKLPKAPASSQTTEPEITSVRAASLESSDDYSLILAQQLGAAEAGDVEAMGTVAKVYEYCQFYSASPTNFEAHVESLAKLDPSRKQALDSVAAKVKKRCDKVMASPSLAEAMTSWLSKAAAAGDVSAIVRTAVLNHEGTSAEERAGLIQAAALSEDPNLMFEAGSLLAFGAASEAADLPVSGGEMDRFAWEIAACRLGADCRAGQNVMDSQCFSGAACNAAGYEDLVRRELVPQGSASVLDRKVREIIEFVSKK